MRKVVFRIFLWNILDLSSLSLRGSKKVLATWKIFVLFLFYFKFSPSASIQFYVFNTNRALALYINSVSRRGEFWINRILPFAICTKFFGDDALDTVPTQNANSNSHHPIGFSLLFHHSSPNRMPFASIRNFPTKTARLRMRPECRVDGVNRNTLDVSA